MRYTPVAAATAADDETEDSDTVVVPSVAKPKQKMVIGGKKKPVVVPDDTEDEEVEPPKEVKKVVGRIGRIGKTKTESDRGGPSVSYILFLVECLSRFREINKVGRLPKLVCYSSFIATQMKIKDLIRSPD